MKVPFTPVIYEHAARFVGQSPWTVSRDPELLFQAHRAAYLEYHQQVIAVGIDIYNLEAEAYGARVEAIEDDGIPAILEPVWDRIEDGFELAPFDPASAGRIPLVLAVGRRLRQEFPEADVRIPVAGPFSIAFNLRGIMDLCADALFQPEATARTLLRVADNQAALCQAVAEAGLDIAFFESAASPPMISPAQFHEIELPALRRMLERAAECLGHPVPCIMGGNTFPIVADLLATGTNYLACNAETDQAAFVASVTRTHPHVRIRVNLNPVIVASPDPASIYAEVDRVLGIIGDRSNCVIGTGALPFETPPENVRLIRDYLDRPNQ